MHDSDAAPRSIPARSRLNLAARVFGIVGVTAGVLVFTAPTLLGVQLESANVPGERLDVETELVIGSTVNPGCACGPGCGCGATCGCGTPYGQLPVSGAAVMTSDNVVLRSNITLGDFSAAAGTGFTAGNDCWGYTSPSGRKYALMGVNAAMVIVEITDPVNPVIVETIPHPSSPWGDVKTFGEYAYVVSDQSGVGVQVVDLTQVDSGIVPAATVVSGSPSTSHNIAVNEDSGFAYLCGSNASSGGLIAVDLSDPANPVMSGAYSSVYVHDAQIITMPDGPWSGREIAFCFVGGAGIDVVDVTNKSNMVRLSRTGYTNLRYSHQGWYDHPTKRIYMNDELDEDATVFQTTTRVFDATDLTSVQFIGSFSTSLPSIDHNLYVRDNIVYQANYRSGFRMFDVAPIPPVQIGFYDTFPGGDEADFDGAWSNYPFFDDNIVIVSDMQRGLFVFDVGFALDGGVQLLYDVSEGAPSTLSPAGQELAVSISGQGGASVDPASVTVTIESSLGAQTLPMTETSPGEFSVTLPSLPCGESATWFYTAQSDSGQIVNEPLSAPVEIFSGQIAAEASLVFFDDFETDLGWTAGVAGDNATTGTWVRVDPVGSPAQPENDASPGLGTDCFITGNALSGAPIGDNDVDGGRTTLISPLLDAVATGDGEPHIEYFRWYSNDLGSNPGDDVFQISISNDDGQTWTDLELVTENTGAWTLVSHRIADFLTPTDEMRVRFIASDLNSPSIVEAGVDDVRVNVISCVAGIPADLDGDGSVGPADLGLLLGAWDQGVGPVPADLDGDGDVGPGDLALMLGAWTG